MKVPKVLSDPIFTEPTAQVCFLVLVDFPYFGYRFELAANFLLMRIGHIDKVGFVLDRPQEGFSAKEILDSLFL